MTAGGLLRWRQRSHLYLGGRRSLSKPGCFLSKLVFANCLFVGISDADIVTSSDGIEWRRNLLANQDNLHDLVFARHLFVAVGDRGSVFTSVNGSDWAKPVSGTSDDLLSVTEGKGIFLAVGRGGRVVSSEDGLSWISRTAGRTDYDLRTLAYGNNMFLVLAKAQPACASSLPRMDLWNCHLGIRKGRCFTMTTLVGPGANIEPRTEESFNKLESVSSGTRTREFGLIRERLWVVGNQEGWFTRRTSLTGLCCQPPTRSGTSRLVIFGRGVPKWFGCPFRRNSTAAAFAVRRSRLLTLLQAVEEHQAADVQCGGVSKPPGPQGWCCDGRYNERSEQPKKSWLGTTRQLLPRMSS